MGVDSSRFDQIPGVAVEVFEDHHLAIGLVTGLFAKDDAGLQPGGVIAHQVVGVEEQPDPAARLIADPGDLFRRRGAGQQQRGLAAFGRDADPAFAAAHVGVFAEVEAQLADEEGDGFVIVADQQADGAEVAHGAGTA